MNCVGIDVSKGKSMIAVMRPFGEVVVSPFEVRHTASELSELARLLKNLDGETLSLIHIFSTVCTIELTIQLDRRMAKMPLRTFAGMFNTSAPFQTTVG